MRDTALDGLRGLAILMIFLFHYGGSLHSSRSFIRFIDFLTGGCWAGIVLFFALSGFLITGSLWDKNHSRHRLRNFYIRRALRILPLYFLALSAAAVTAVLAGATLRQLKPFFVFAFFLQNLPHLAAYALHNPSPLPLHHLWTLAVEAQFYLFWPIILFFAHSRRHALRLSLWCLALSEFFVLAIYTLPALSEVRAAHLYDHFLLTQSAALALGCAASLAMGNRSDPSGRKPSTHRVVRKYASPAFFTGLGIFFVIGFHAHSLRLISAPQYWLGLPAISLAAAATIPLVLRSGLPRKVFSLAPLGWLGRISYAFYLFHILLEPVFDRLGAQITHTNTGDTYHIARALVAFVITCAVSWLSFHLFETPILSLKRHFPVNLSLPWGEPIAEPHHSHRKYPRSHTWGTSK